MGRILFIYIVLFSFSASAQTWKNIRINGTTLGANKFLKSDADGLITGSLLGQSDVPFAIWNQTAVIQTADSRISGTHYANNIVLGLPFVASGLGSNRVYSASRALISAEPMVVMATFADTTKETLLDTTFTLSYFRVSKDTLSFSSSDPGSAHVRAGSLLGQMSGAGAVRSSSILLGAISIGQSVGSIGFYAETAFLDPTSMAGNIRFKTKTSGDQLSTEKMRLTAAGFLAVNTTVPMARVHINGTNPLALTGLQAGGTTDSLLTILNNIVRKIPLSTFWNTTGNAGTSSANSFLGTTDNISMRIKTNNLLRIVIDSAFGNVAIGGAITNRKLNVTDSSTVVYSATGSTAFPAGLFSGITNTSPINGSMAGFLFNPTNSGSTGQIGYMGAVSNNSGFAPDIVIGQRNASATYAERIRLTAAGLVGVGTSTPNSTLHVSGATSHSITTVTGNTTLDGTHWTVLVNNSGNVTMTLPAAAGCSGRVYNIKKIATGAFTVTIQGNGAENIDAANTNVITAQWDSRTIQSNGTQWFIL